MPVAVEIYHMASLYNTSLESSHTSNTSIAVLQGGEQVDGQFCVLVERSRDTNRLVSIATNAYLYREGLPHYMPQFLSRSVVE